MAKDRLTKTTDITVSVREIDFVTRFTQNWQSLQEILGIMDPVRKTPGTKLVSSKATVTLQSGSVAEGNEIPYSQATVVPVAYDDITIEKYAKAVSIESVAKYGAAVAVQKTDDAFLNELQGLVLDRFYTFLQTGELTSVESTFQMAVSMAIGRVVDKFKKMRKDYSRIVVFANTLDAYEYLGAAGISIQNAFGIQYVQDFLGASTMILSSEIPQGKVIAIPADNIVLYYIDPSDSDFAQLGLEYTVEGETNLIGFHANGNYTTAVGESFAIMGLKLWAEYIDAISIVTISSASSAGTATFTSGAGTTAGTKITVTAPASLTPDLDVYVKAQASTAPDVPAYLAPVDATWTKLTLDENQVADNVTGFTSGHKMVMAIVNGAGQTVYTASSGVTVVNHA